MSEGYVNPYPDQRFMEEHRKAYDRYTGYDSWEGANLDSRRLDDPEPFSRDELLELRRLLWASEDTPSEIRGDWRLARDHAPDFVYSVAVRLVEDSLKPALRLPRWMRK